MIEFKTINSKLLTSRVIGIIAFNIFLTSSFFVNSFSVQSLPLNIYQSFPNRTPSSERQTYDCKSHNNGSEWHCQVDKGPGNTAFVNVTNIANRAVTFTWDEWHMHQCGWHSNKLRSKKAVAGPGATTLLNMSSAGSGINCRSVYILNCFADGQRKPCPAVIKATWTTHV